MKRPAWLMNSYLKYLPALLLLLTTLGGCASTPEASLGRDAEAKRFISHPATAAIYVYRVDMGGGDQPDSVLYVDGRLIGATLPRAYFRIDVNPGQHVLNGVGQDQGKLELETRPGQNYFVELSVIAGNSFFTVVDPPTAQQTIIACCALLENWAPGQRPLLR
ncbi:MAG: DUF2846 domain-containing protein [Burkholderiales bacterium]